MKHIKPKDIVEFMVFGLLVALLIFVSGYLESTPIYQGVIVAGVLASILWIIWGVLTYRDRRPRLMVWIDGRGWVDTSENDETYEDVFLHPKAVKLRQTQLYDQDADAIAHLDFDKENNQ